MCTLLRGPALPNHVLVKISVSSMLSTSRVNAWVLIMLGIIMQLGILCAIMLSNFLPVSGNHVTEAMQSDRYYFLLVPLTLPIIIVAVYFHWLSMKLFKHA